MINLRANPHSVYMHSRRAQFEREYNYVAIACPISFCIKVKHTSRHWFTNNSPTSHHLLGNVNYVK